MNFRERNVLCELATPAFFDTVEPTTASALARTHTLFVMTTVLHISTELLALQIKSRTLAVRRL